MCEISSFPGRMQLSHQTGDGPYLIPMARLVLGGCGTHDTRNTMHRIRTECLLACFLCCALPAWAQAPAPLIHPTLVAQETLNAADTAWMMTSTALVLLMTLPGIALFYGGMVRKKNVLDTMASVVAAAALVSLLWFAVGYSLAFTPGSEWLGGGSRLWFSGLDYLKVAGKVAVSHAAPNVPESVYAMFQHTFAIITAALIV